MNNLTITDLDTTVSKGEPRILDLRLAERLGYARPRKLRALIVRNLPELETYGTLAPRRGAPISGKGRVQEVDEYHLNEGQALVVILLSRTPAAAQVRREVIEVYMAWRRGELKPSGAKPVNWGCLGGSIMTQVYSLFMNSLTTDWVRFTPRQVANIVRMPWSRSADYIDFLRDNGHIEIQSVPGSDARLYRLPGGYSVLPIGRI